MVFQYRVDRAAAFRHWCRAADNQQDRNCDSNLSNAKSALAVDGWASVEAAADWISAQYPDQTPEKYGCRTWRQVIHESRRFDLRYRYEDSRKQAWYQERAKIQKVER